MKSKIVFVFLLISVLVFILWKSYSDYLNLRKSHNFDYAVVDNVVTSSKGSGAFIKYHFVIDGEIIKGSTQLECTNIACLEFVRGLLIGQKMPVVYENQNPLNSEIILESESFRKFNLKPKDFESRISKSVDSILKVD